MDIDAVLFDLDNTLFDHATSARAGIVAFLHANDVEAGTDLADAWFEIERIEYARWVDGEVSFQEQRGERLRRFLPLVGRATPGRPEVLSTSKVQKLRACRAHILIGVHSVRWSGPGL